MRCQSIFSSRSICMNNKKTLGGIFRCQLHVRMLGHKMRIYFLLRLYFVIFVKAGHSFKLLKRLGKDYLEQLQHVGFVGIRPLENNINLGSNWRKNKEKKLR